MDAEYDVVCLGTGFKESVLSGLLSVHGYRVLHMDRNDFYGGECASLNITALFERFNREKDQDYGKDRLWNIDLIPKFIMSDGVLVQMLTKTKTYKYLNFHPVDGSFVLKGSKIHKVPSTSGEALKSSLMGIFEKRKARKFFAFVGQYEVEQQSTWELGDLSLKTMQEVYEYFGLKPDTIDFVGHAMGLYETDDYIKKPALDAILRIKLYCTSVLRFGNSPYIYPEYGLSDLPQAFARLSAVYGGCSMLRRDADEIVYGDDGRVVGVKSQGEVARCKMVVGDPSYFPDLVRTARRVVRGICLLPEMPAGSGDAGSCQIILPQKQTGRTNDIYIACVSSVHMVAPEGVIIAIASTIVETEDPESELQAAFELMGHIAQKFVTVSPIYEPTHDGKDTGVFITQSCDSTSHFESECQDIMDVWKRITGKDLDLTPEPEEAEEGEEGEEGEKGEKSAAGAAEAAE